MKRYLTFLAIGGALVWGGCSHEPASTVIATAMLEPASQSQVRGTVSFIQDGNKVRVEASLSGLAPGEHGFHIHEHGDCSAPDASSAGGHFNPGGMPHGSPGSRARHVGDLGNITVGADGKAHYSNVFEDLQFNGARSIIGKSVVVHGSQDDLKTQPGGDAGARVACGVIIPK